MSDPEACEAWHPDESIGIECDRDRHDGDPNHEGHFLVTSGTDCRRVAVHWKDRGVRL